MTDEACADERRGLWFDARPQGVAKTTGAFIWLAFILFPAASAVAKHGSALGHSLTIFAAVAFVALYIALVLLWRRRMSDRLLPVLFVGLVAIASALTLSDGSAPHRLRRSAVPPAPECCFGRQRRTDTAEIGRAGRAHLHDDAAREVDAEARAGMDEQDDRGGR